MYQSVGTNLVPLIAQALRKPLYQRIIRGKPISTSLSYGATERGGRQHGTSGDETEDLLELLKDVLVRSPEDFRQLARRHLTPHG
jgi:diphthamide synthase (EF-2-diphthine--ammonia ligase)